MQHRLKTQKHTLEGFVLCAAGTGRKAFQASRLKNLRQEFASQALELRHLFIWFPEDRQAIIAAARKGAALMRAHYAKHRTSIAAIPT